MIVVLNDNRSNVTWNGARTAVLVVYFTGVVGGRLWTFWTVFQNIYQVMLSVLSEGR